MTAEIAILNQSGVAMAADSAVTIGLENNDKKIYNTANKLFMLSKYHPIGIMIYNSASIMGVEWEMIIKQYRKKLGTTKFDTLQEYFDDLILYLVQTDIFPDKLKEDYCDQQFISVLKMVQKEIKRRAKEKIDKDGEVSEDQLKILISETLHELKKIVEGDSIIGLSLSDFKEKYKDKIETIISGNFKNISDDNKNDIAKVIYHNLASFALYKNYTGIVISGYGEKEYFPQLQ
jgi:hypothetical protein